MQDLPRSSSLGWVELKLPRVSYRFLSAPRFGTYVSLCRGHYRATPENMAWRKKHLNSTGESTSSLRNGSNIWKRYKALGRRADGQCFDNFDITDWVDYVRGVVPEPDKGVMTRHLAEGCASCAHLVLNFVN